MKFINANKKTANLMRGPKDKIKICWPNDISIYRKF